MAVRRSRFQRGAPRVWVTALPWLLAGLAACRSQPSARSVEDAADHAETSIAWYAGDVESAFSHAEAIGKPLFLYWGAEWCPPCHYLKTKIFNRPEFLEKMNDFVLVYLDGDSENAQSLGEKLDVRGYPTVIVFDPVGQEVTRMPSTIPVEQYAEVLDAIVASMKPVTTVLRDVLQAGPARAERDDLRRLAFYSWGQDSRLDLTDDERAAAFRRLFEETPARFAVERSRFLALYLQERSRQSQVDGADRGAELSEGERESLQSQVLELLAVPALRNANLVWVSFSAGSVIDLLQPEGSAGRTRLIAAWQRAAVAMEADETLSVDDRLTATLLRVELARLPLGDEETDGRLPPELTRHVREQIAWAIEAVQDESELQTVINTMAHLLDRSELSSEAEQLLLDRMNDTAAPYYFMSWVATLKEDAGEIEDAVVWHRRAYDSARGRYSRFRWGSAYLRHLMELTPQNLEPIEADSVEILTELLTHDDAFAGGNHSRLESLEAAYWTWGETGDREASLARIRGVVHSACERFSDEGVHSQRRRCETFLVAEKTEGEAAG